MIAVITVFHLFNAALGKSFYRDQHLGCALKYAQGSIDLLRPVILGFNLNEAPTPLEVPVWQATVALVFKALGTWYGWANLVSLLFLFSGLYPLFKVAERFAGPGTGWWTLLLFLAQPNVVMYAGEAGPDGQALAASIWFLYCASKLWEAPGAKWLFWTALTGSLSALTKVPFFMAAGLGCFFMTALCYRRQKSAWIYLGIAAAFCGVRPCSREPVSQASLPSLGIA